MSRERKPVVIIGAGASGLTSAALLHRSGIECVVLEKRSEARLQERQRAGMVENRNARTFIEWGLQKLLTGFPYDGYIDFRLNGVRHDFTMTLSPEHAGAPDAHVVPQQVLVMNLLNYLREVQTDLRFEVDHVSITGLEGNSPVVSYTAKDGSRHEIECDFIGGCDGFHGVSRGHIPEKALTTYEHDYGMSWLTWVSDAAPRTVMALSNHGYAAHYPRGYGSRVYLQCKASDTLDDWPDERIWPEFQKRMKDDKPVTGSITEKLVFPLRSVVFDPMRYGRLFLVGDSAHIILPCAGKGMNLALYDAEQFVLAVRGVLKQNDDSFMRNYSKVCLARTWDYQEFSFWVHEMIHHPATMAKQSGFLRQLAIARYERVFTSGPWARAFSELLAGLT